MRFTIENPMGAVRTTQRQKYADPRYRKYEAYKGIVRMIADVAGVPGEIPKDRRASVTIRAFWSGRALCDLDNLVKGVLDALWKQDRRVDWIHARHFENSGDADYADVRVEITEQRGAVHVAR